MSNEKFSPQLLRTILESDGVDTSEMKDMPTLSPPGQSSIKPLDAAERKKALKQLASLISQFRSVSSNPEQLMSFNLDELPNILRLLAELATEVKVDDKNREEKKKVLHVAAAMLRRMLHMPDASHYRVLGLDPGATPAQITEHYQLLYKLFWFDETIDPQRKSRLRISEAYTVLKEPESRYRYDEDLARLEQQALRSANSGRRRGVWGVLAAVLLVGLGLSGILLFSGKDETSDTDMVSLPTDAGSDDGGEAVVAETASQLPDAASTSSQDMVSMPADDMELPAEQLSMSEESTADLELELPETVPLRDDEKPDGQQSVPEQDVANVRLELPEATLLPAQRAVEKPENKLAAAIKTEEGSSPSGSVGEENVVPQQDDPELLSAQTPVQKYDISKPEETASTSMEGEGDVGDLSFSVDIPPVVQQPEAALVISPRVGGPDLKEQATATEELPASASLSPPSSGLQEEVEPAMVVIGSPDLSVDSLTKEQVQALFLGKESRLPSGERVTVVTQQGSGSIKETFYRDVIGKTSRQLKIHWAKLRFKGRQQPPNQLVDDEAVRDAVANSSGMIGIIRNTAVDDSVKVLLDTDTGQ